ncbi:thiamine phosphate synthase [Acidobacteriota bacterium]
MYLVTDGPLCLGRNIIEVVKEAVAGGVTVVQLREKEASARKLLCLGSELQAFLKERRIPLIVNDRVDIARALDVDGVHLGNNDMPIGLAREILGPDKIIGLSAESVEEAESADQMGADYIGVSPVFTTPTKPELETGLGFEGLRRIRETTSLPLVAIGGMNASNSRLAIQNGADGVAVVSAICSAENPETAARAILEEVRKGRALRA